MAESMACLDMVLLSASQLLGACLLRDAAVHREACHLLFRAPMTRPESTRQRRLPLSIWSVPKLNATRLLSSG